MHPLSSRPDDWQGIFAAILVVCIAFAHLVISIDYIHICNCVDRIDDCISDSVIVYWMTLRGCG